MTNPRSLAFIHLAILPRWFALPIAFAGIGLGLALADAPSWGNALMAFAMGAALMAFAHVLNAWFDYAVTKLDQGEAGERSRTKPYTGGQDLIASGQVSVRAVVFNSLAWLAVALLLATLLSLRTTPWLWLPVLLCVACAPWYSWAKLHWHPELPLGLGFATAATWIGMATGGEIDWLRGLLASLPLFLSFGVMAELVDQAWDAGPNWAKGARSLGMLIARLDKPVVGLVSFIVFVVANMIQIPLALMGILAYETFVAWLAIPPMLVAAASIDNMYELKLSPRKGVTVGLLTLIAYQVVLVLLQATFS